MTAGKICLLSKKQLKERGITFCNYYLLHLESKGQFPQRIRLGARTVSWCEHEIDEWIAARAAERIAA